MTPYEILLSESQERMLVVATQGREDEVRAILEKWDLTAAVIGEVIAEPVYRVTEGDRVVAEFPGNRLVTDCPHVHAGRRESAEVIAPARARRARDPERAEEARSRCGRSTRLLSSPTIASKTWVYRQYDTTVRTNTVDRPGRRRRGAPRARHRTRPSRCKTDCNGRYVYLDPARRRADRRRRGGAQRRLHRRAADGDHQQPQLRQSAAARSLLPVPRGGRRHGRCVPRARHAGHRRQRLAVQREPARRRLPDARRSAWSASSTSLAHVTRSAFQHAGDADRAARRTDATNWARASTCARIHGDRGRRAAARATSTRERALIDALLEAIAAGARAHRRTTAATAGWPSRSPSAASWIAERRSGATVDLAAWSALPSRALLFGEAQGRVDRLDDGSRRACSAIAARHGVPARGDRHRGRRAAKRFDDHGAATGAARRRRLATARRRVPRRHSAHHVDARRHCRPSSDFAVDAAVRASHAPRCAASSAFAATPTRPRSRTSGCTRSSIAARSRSGVVVDRRHGQAHAVRRDGHAVRAIGATSWRKLPGIDGRRTHALQHGRLVDHRERAADLSRVPRAGTSRSRTTATSINAGELRRELEDARARSSASTMDSEVIVHRLARVDGADARPSGWPRRCSGVEGAYSLVVAIGDTLIAARDPRGWRPLAMGRLGDAVVFASETCALDIVGATVEREVEPGEIIAVDDDRRHASMHLPPMRELQPLRVRVRLLRAPRQPRLRRIGGPRAPRARTAAGRGAPGAGRRPRVQRARLVQLGGARLRRGERAAATSWRSSAITTSAARSSSPRRRAATPR